MRRKADMNGSRIATLASAFGRVIGVVCVLASIAAIAPASAQSEQIQSRRLKFAMAVGVGSPWTQGAMRFAKQVEADTAGKIRVTVYPDGQLSNGNQVAEFELLKNGTVDFTWHSSIILSIIDPRFALFSLPWIAASNEALFALIDGPGQNVWTGLDKVGVVPLGAYSTSGFRQLTNSKKPVGLPGDLQGMTLRVPGLKLYQGIFKQLGANPVPTSFGELYGALQQGVVDGQENPLSLIFVSKFDEVQKYLTVWNYSADAIGVLSNSKLWSTLSPREREIFTKAAKDAAQWHRQAQAEADGKALEALQKRLQIVRLNAEQINAFRQAMKPIYAEWESIIGQDLMRAVAPR